MNLRLKLNNDAFIYGKPRKNVSRNILTGIASIIIALIMAIIFATMLGYNPIDIFAKLFTKGFSEYQFLINYLGIFTLAGLAFAMTSRAGVFNIGISGQMLGAGTAIIFFIKLLNDLGVTQSIPNGVGQLLIIIIAMCIGGLIASIIGLMEVHLKVNSVVSSILINWIIYFLSMFLINAFAAPEGTGSGNPATSSITIPDNFRLIISSGSLSNTAGTIPIITIIVIVSALMFFLFKYTVFGHKIKSIGFSLDSSLYAGYKIKTIKVSAFLMSGMIAGLLACVLYTSQSSYIPIATSVDAIPTEGFDAIAISLVGGNNPIGIVAVSFIFALFKSSLPAANIPPSYLNLLFGFMMLGASLSVVIIKLRPIVFLKSLKYGKGYLEISDDFETKISALFSKYQSIMKYEKKNVYSQNISKVEKKKLWKQTLLEISQDYQIEKKLIFDQFSAAKLSLLIKNKGDLKNSIISRYKQDKYSIDLETTKKISSKKDQIHKQQLRILNLKNDRVAEINHTLDELSNSMNKSKNKYDNNLRNLEKAAKKVKNQELRQELLNQINEVKLTNNKTIDLPSKEATNV